MLTGTETDQKSTGLISDNQASLVRGRVKEEGKPSTFNQLWTIEEQKRSVAIPVESLYTDSTSGRSGLCISPLEICGSRFEL